MRRRLRFGGYVILSACESGFSSSTGGQEWGMDCWRMGRRAAARDERECEPTSVCVVVELMAIELVV
eukprot:SAG22_NODE_9320_length_596_cov_1.140845_3_plen_66_part_01